jgi:hypothetical protein
MTEESMAWLGWAFFLHGMGASPSEAAKGANEIMKALRQVTESDLTGVESSLDKILRLSQVKGYQRVQRGRVQQVHQYVNTKVAHPQVRWTQAAWSKLKAGDVISIGGRSWKVIRVNVPPLPPLPANSAQSTGSQGAGVNTGGPQSTGSQGTGVNTGGPASTASQGQGLNTGAAIAAAANGGKAVPYGAKTVTNVIQDILTGNQYFVYLPPGTVVPVRVA